jgi:hypothetical protein
MFQQAIMNMLETNGNNGNSQQSKSQQISIRYKAESWKY